MSPSAESGVLKAILYERGKLELLDQRKLPLESTYINIPDADAAWHAIKDMVVRGAPAIAIAAALALAAELAVSPPEGTAESAAARVKERLDFLVTSRPTAVNLADAAGKLTAVAEAAAKGEGSTAASVVEAYLAAAERMLADDVADNEAIGRHGAEFLLAHTGREGGAHILTHCNTGSLATAAFGTALGVIRTVQQRGKLLKAFCTETRPYNQGARLTAFELVHDGAPATLIADSAAAALMASGEVDAVVVGADRIAANGDTANKIGTYSLAVNARAHGVPFYVAAPLTTVDVHTASGEGIVIEQRDPRELTHALGGAGPQVAPNGIGIWNPSFDVTPARLITAIFTDKGVVEKREGADVFDVPAFVAAAAARGREGAGPEANGAGPVSTAGGGAGGAGAGGKGFHILNEKTAAEYAQGQPDLQRRLGGSASEWSVKEVGDGNLNLVFILEGPAGALVLKQSLPYVRCVGEQWRLSERRSYFEVRTLQEHGKLVPQHVPEIYLVDDPMCVIGMHYIAPPHIILRKGLIKGVVYPHLAEHVSEYMARTLFFTSLLAIPTTEHRQKVAEYCGNVEMCRLTEQVIFTEPYFAAANNHWTTPELDAEVAAIRADGALKRHVAVLKASFMERAQALLHGDLHTGSIMVTPDSTQVIDPEFAFYGPMGFDVGAFLANLALAYVSQEGHATAVDDRAESRKWILQTLADTWTLFADKFCRLWTEHAEKPGDAFAAEVYDAALLAECQEEYMAAVLQDALGFAAAKMIRRIVGIAHVEDLESIADRAVRAKCERKALGFATQLMKTRSSIKSIREVVDNLAAL